MNSFIAHCRKISTKIQNYKNEINNLQYTIQSDERLKQLPIHEWIELDVKINYDMLDFILHDSTDNNQSIFNNWFLKLGIQDNDVGTCDSLIDSVLDEIITDIECINPDHIKIKYGNCFDEIKKINYNTNYYIILQQLETLVDCWFIPIFKCLIKHNIGEFTYCF